jgi:hypothetical protein
MLMAEVRPRSQEVRAMSGHAFQIKIDGRAYSGTYDVDRQVLTVKTSYGKRAAPIPPRVGHHTLAEQVLRELVLEEKGRKGSRL